jgi:RNA polymerase sigma-70 factor (ECF subfamily)
VIHFLYRMVENQALAEELALEVFLRFYRAGTGSNATRLFRIAADLALSELRNSKDQSGARHVIAFLPAKQRAAVLLHKYHQMDCRQIAQVLNCRDSAAKSLLCLAYATLRRQVAAYDRKSTGFSGEPTRFQNGFDPLQQVG